MKTDFPPQAPTVAVSVEEISGVLATLHTVNLSNKLQTSTRSASCVHQMMPKRRRGSCNSDHDDKNQQSIQKRKRKKKGKTHEI
jgi:hypothetical protein